MPSVYWYLFKIGYWGAVGATMLVDIIGAPFVGRDIIK